MTMTVSQADCSADAKAGVRPSRRNAPLLAVIVVLSGQFMANMDSAIANLATPSIGATLHANGSGQQWVVAAYVLTSAMFMITAARLSSVFGDRVVFITGLAIFTASSLACGIAGNILELIVGRAVQGIGGAMMVGQVLSAIQARLQGEALTRAIGAYTVALSLSAAVGQLAGGAIVTANIFGLSWRPLFLLNVPIGIILLAGAIQKMDEQGRSEGRLDFDVWGAATLALAMVCCVLPLTLGYASGWPLWTIATLAVSILALGIFVVRERRLTLRGGVPLVDLRLFTIAGVSAGLIAMALTRVVYFSLLFVIAVYLQGGLHQTALQSGLALLSWLVAYGVSGAVYPAVPKRFSRLIAPIGCLVVAICFVALAPLHGTGVTFYALLGLAGLAFGMLSTSLVDRLTEIVPRAFAANLSGLLATMVPLMAAIGVATFGSVYFAYTATGGAVTAIRSFALLCGLFAVTSVAAGVSSAYAMRGQRRV
jgi:MFS family permease